MIPFWALPLAQAFEEPEDDALVWLSDQWWTPWALQLLRSA